MVRSPQGPVRLQVKLTVAFALLGAILILLYRTFNCKELILAGALIMLISPYISSLIVIKSYLRKEA